MNSAIAKTLSLIILILIGYFLKKRIINKEQKSGIKEIILGVALPAMIFIALQKVIFQVELLIIPIVALIFNFVMFFLTDFLTGIFKIGRESSAHRTFKLLVPSLAPGLSCFPFLLEYLGEETLANAALADIGNKIFVLIFLYLVSMRWYYQSNNLEAGSNKEKIKSLIQSMIKEPVNFIILVALVMLGFGISYETFPAFIQMSVDRLSLIMTPLVLLFIGVSVKMDWSQVKTIMTVLLCRSAMAFIISGLLIYLFRITEPAMILLIILFPQSSCSFWPFAHMSAVSKQEEKRAATNATFDLDFAMNILAFSLPFSTVLILSICTFSNQVAKNTSFPIIIGMLFFVTALLPLYIKYLQKGIIFKPLASKSE